MIRLQKSPFGVSFYGQNAEKHMCSTPEQIIYTETLYNAPTLVSGGSESTKARKLDKIKVLNIVESPRLKSVAFCTPNSKPRRTQTQSSEVEHMDPMDRRTPEQIERDALQNKYAHNYLLIPMPVMMNPELTLADKAVFGRAYGFDFLFESPTQTAAVLGISPSQVRVSKRKLEKMGLLACVEENFFGKKYVARLANYTYPLSESDNPPVKICQPPCQNLTTENKERLKGEENHSLKDKSFKESSEPTSENDEPLKEEPEKPKRYGKAEINEILDDWEAATDFQWHGVRQERFAVNTLLRKFGLEATKALVRRVRVARRSDDQFAPQIAKPSQLVGKYEKLTALTMWEERCARIKAKAAEMEGPDFRKLYNMGERPEDESEDYAPEYTAEEKQNRRDFVNGLREKYGFKRKEADNE